MELTEKMFELVEAYQRSGKTQKQYSEHLGIGYAKFNYWACKYRKQKQNTPTAGFIKLDPLPVSDHQELEILYPNGVRLKASAADLSLIGQLIHLC